MLLVLRCLTLACGVFLLFLPATATDRPSIAVPTLSVDSDVLEVDGRLEESVWQSAAVITDLHQVRPNEYGPPSATTEVRLFFTGTHLHVAAILRDDPALIAATHAIQGRSTDSDDQFHIVLDTHDNRRSGYLFQLTPSGVRADGLVDNTRVFADWEAIWQGTSRIDESGWVAEMAIPFQSLSFDPGVESWGVNVGRVLRRNSEILAWSSGGIDSWELAPAAMGRMNAPRIDSQAMGLEVQFSGVVAHEIDRLGGRVESRIEPSIDVFYKPSPALTLAATVNTDFSATEVDDRVVNLTRYSVFLPEKRAFFLQDTDIFEFGGLSSNGRPFFSRSIGIDAAGQAVGIDVGVKLTGRAGGFNYGVLGVQQDDGNRIANLSVARLAVDILEESSIGLIATDGDPRSDSGNRLWGADLHLRNSSIFDGKQLEARAWVQHSASHDDHSGSDNDAFGFKLAYPNDDVFLQLAHNNIGDDFDSAMGFVNRTGIRETRFDYGSTVRLENGILRTWNPWIGTRYVTDQQNRMESRHIIVYPTTFHLRDNTYLQSHVTEVTEVMDSDFTIFDDVVVPSGRYDDTRYGLRWTSPRNLPLYADVFWEGGEFFGGERDWLSLGGGWRPSRYLAFSAASETTWARLPGGNFVARLYRLNSEVAFNGDWSWVTSVQFDNGSSQLGINSRLRYQPHAGQSFTLVVNHGMRETDSHFNSEQASFVAKFSYSARF